MPRTSTRRIAHCDTCGRKLDPRGTNTKCRSCGPTTHGLTGSYYMDAWNQMIQRCHNPRNRSFAGYGGRGIAVCERWRHSLSNFVADMGPRPSESNSLDRYPNNDGNYEPGNCRWATAREQMRNTRRAKLIHFNGKTLCVAEWARLLGVTPTAIHSRLKKMPAEKALTK